MKTLFYAGLIIVLISGVACAEQTTVETKWVLGFDYSDLIAYDNPDFNTSFRQNSTEFDISYFSLNASNEAPSFIFIPRSTMLSFGGGISTPQFSYNYAPGDYTQFQFLNDTFVSTALAIDAQFVAFPDLYLDATAAFDLGTLDNLQYLHKKTGVTVWAGKGDGSWDAVNEVVKFDYKNSGLTVFLGVNAYSFNYSLTYSDYSGMPGYEKQYSGNIFRAGFITGLEYQLSDGFNIGGWTNIASDKTVLMGYQMYASCIF